MLASFHANVITLDASDSPQNRPVHCPNCRHDNPPTTRFCAGCGAVLVENTPDGRRRRVLRPWGLGSAPLTESPAMPEIAAASKAPPRRAPRRFDVVFIGGTIAVTMAAMLAYPYARALEAPVGIGHHSVLPLVAAPAEWPLLDAYRRVRPARAPWPQAFRLSARSKLSAPDPVGPEVPSPVRRASEDVPLPEMAAAPPATLATRAASPLPAVLSRPESRWQPLADRLRLCVGEPGLFRRAACEQGARLAYCDGFWGLVDQCPARIDYGQ